MSFRELRNFTEMMRALGYHRPISMENFRTPNFELVSDMLFWLVKRYEPNADITKQLDTMQDRVIFLKQCAQLMASKGRIKLNPKRLYQADGYAVKELIKIASVLYSSMQSNPDDDDDLSVGGEAFSIKLNDLKDVRDLATDITQHGASLAELLAKEDSLRDARQRAISRDMQGSDDVHKFIQESIQSAKDNMSSKSKLMGDLKTDEAALEKKLQKKVAELERNQKRLLSLQTVRPAFMDEYEKLEEDLQDMYREYLERFRNLDYIEGQLETYNKQEQERIDENERQMKKMQKKLKEEEMKVLRGDVQLDENDLEDTLLDDQDSDDDLGRPPRGGERPKTKSGARSQVVGSLNGPGSVDDDSASDSDEDLSMSGDDDDLLNDDSDQGSEGDLSGSDDGGSGSMKSDDSEHSF
uniref:Clusterin-associated protein 1 n=1 Tax=Hemiselmis andersenii TaxID=464988 RepID=A0A6T8KI49_HEMAN